MFALDNRDLHAKLRRPDRGNITARAGADDRQVKSLVSHGLFAPDYEYSSRL
jgi:hypothetical protein